MNQHRHTHRQFALILITFWVLGLASMPTFAAKGAASAEVDGAIEYLMSQTLQSKATFVRNGESHTAEEAVEHIKKKYEHFRKKGRVKTPEDFIRLAATKSLISGKAYLLKFQDGSELKSAEWLTGKLKRHRAQQVGP